MIRQWFNRDLWPRRYSAWIVAVACTLQIVFIVCDTSGRLTIGQCVWIGILSVIAISSLGEATTGFMSRRIRRRYNARRIAGLCGQCGYDLRATTSVTCPECGAWHGTTPGKRFWRGK